MNIIEYVKKYGNYSFDEYEFNEVDSIIICQLTYFNYSDTPVCNSNLDYNLGKFLNNDYCKERVKGIWNPKRNDTFAKIIKNYKRFNQLSIGFYESTICLDSQKQFSACVFKIKEDTYYISYRGTDANFVGWKEDFNLGYLENIPSQISAVKYFENFVSKYQGKYYIGGHSKGGNLAIYAGVMCNEIYKENIIKIYNHDGPGFLPEFYQKSEYINIKDRIEKTIPKTAIVGLLLEPGEDYHIVDSKALLILQHDLFNWIVDDSHLKYINSTTKFSKHTRNSINNWITEIDLETREVFINTIYSLILETKDEKISQFVRHGIKNMYIMHKKLKGLDLEVKKTVKKVFRAFCKSYIGLNKKNGKVKKG